MSCLLPDRAEQLAQSAFSDRFARWLDGLKQAFRGWINDMVGLWIRHLLGGWLRALANTALGQKLISWAMQMLPGGAGLATKAATTAAGTVAATTAADGGTTTLAGTAELAAAANASAGGTAAGGTATGGGGLLAAAPYAVPFALAAWALRTTNADRGSAG